MKFNTTIPKKLLPYFEKEMEVANCEFQKGNYQNSWYHLERAHIIGQKYPWQHSYAHYKMLVFGIKIKNVKEIIGQIPRLLVGSIKSFVNIIPVGNTGGANVPPLRPMEIPEDIQKMFNIKM